MGVLPNAAQEASRAHDLFQRWRDEFMADPNLTALLGKYQAAIDASRAAYQDHGIPAFCARCGQIDEQACCFQGAERWYGHRLLLLNLLLGGEVPHTRELEEECFFMGREGCKLMARCGICLNFYCPALTATLGDQVISQLLKLVGAELWASSEAEQRLAWLINREEKLMVSAAVSA